MTLVINILNISAHLWTIPLLRDISPEWREAEGSDSRFCPKIFREEWIYGSEELVHLETTKSLRSGGSLNTEQSVPRQGKTGQVSVTSTLVKQSLCLVLARCAGIVCVWINQKFWINQSLGESSERDASLENKRRNYLISNFAPLKTDETLSLGFWVSTTGIL